MGMMCPVNAAELDELRVSLRIAQHISAVNRRTRKAGLRRTDGCNLVGGNTRSDSL